MTSPLLLPAYPPLVQGLHAGFLSHLRADLPISPYLDASSRGELEGLLDKGAPIREIADELLFSTITGWSQLPGMKEAGVSARSHFGVEALFKPMEKGNVVFGADDAPPAGRKADAAAIGRGIAHQHLSANRYVEVSYPHGTPGLETYFTVHAELNVYGLYLFAMHGDHAVLRIPSLTFFESALKYCLGRRALTPCFAAGEVEYGIVNQLHKSGFHALGEPLRKLRMHGRLAEPADYTIHDLAHLIHSSIQLTLLEQRTASLFYESGSALLKGNPKLRQIWTLLSDDFSHLMNLEVGPGDGKSLMEILAKTKRLLVTVYGQESVDTLFDHYQAKVDRFFRTDEKKDESLRRELAAFRDALQKIRTDKLDLRGL
ncbi:MAG TPA: hypothetical protein VFX30_14245 [bacterium]|nr:hypothetical protein [bacterium]